MLADGRELPEGLVVRARVCVIGSGPAGMTTALGLADAGVDVCLLESGGLQPNTETQALYEGRNIGRDYFPLHTARLRVLGGTSYHWTGQCRPLDASDLEIRPWISNSAWPLSLEELEPYYSEAHGLIGLGAYNYDAESWASEGYGTVARLEPTRFRSKMFHQLATRFGLLFQSRLEESQRIQTYIHSTVVDLELGADGATLSSARVKTLAGNEFQVQADVFVLACGGIDSARLLLASRSTRDAGLGNENGLVGRYFMEHLHIYNAGTFVPSGRFSGLLYLPHRPRPPQVFGVFALSEEAQRDNELLNAAITLVPTFPDSFWRSQASEGWGSFREIGRSLGRRRAPDDGFAVHIWNVVKELDRVANAAWFRASASRIMQAYRLFVRSEQEPNRDSRVMLNAERDALGVPKVDLRWQLVERDVHTIQSCVKLFGQAVGEADLGRVSLREATTEALSRHIVGGWHHMGTTRMSPEPTKGVVDVNCKVHSVNNLYVGGSSVFPTSGYANPTLTIVALAMRLVDHLMDRVA